MKKIFRMQYEPCKGACYSPDQEFFNEIKDTYDNNRGLFNRLIKALLAIHDQVCGNENLAYMIDYDEENKLYIAAFWHYGELDLFSDHEVIKALGKLIYAALDYYNTDEYKYLSTVKPGSGHDVCEHGEDHKLSSFINKCSGIT